MKIKEIYETGKDSGLRLGRLPARSRISHAAWAPVSVTIDPTKTFQTVEGFGGALTESAAYVLGTLDKTDRNRVLEAYFDPENGIGYTLARTHINSCDFSLDNWACIEQKDESLESFSMERTDRWITPLVRDALTASGGRMHLMLTSWSPPAWMKDNNDMNNGGRLLDGYENLWARYMVRFMKEMRSRGVPLWCVSVQNEPEATQTWDSCRWTAEAEGRFACEHLGPEMEKEGFGSVPILVWDHNRDRLFERMQECMNHPGADKYIGGAAFHWYSGDQYDCVARTAEKWPDKMLVFTEGCIEGGARPGAWFPGERYAHNIINDLNAGCTAWVDWNIALDLEGGPNHAGNFCDAPVLVDTERGTFTFQSSYWYLGHFSKFIKPGAIRLGSSIESGMTPATVDGRLGNAFEACAFRNPDGTTAVVLCNRTEADMIYGLDAGADDGRQLLFCPPRSIQTVLIE